MFILAYTTKETIRYHIESHAGDIYLLFSGGKDSIVLAHFCEEWKERITLVWLNTGYQAPHVLEYVLAYKERGWKLVELSPPHDVKAHWQENGYPTEVLSIQRQREIPLKAHSWIYCCTITRGQPLEDFLEKLQGFPLVLSGIRLDDGGPIKDNPAEWCRPCIDIDGRRQIHPLRDWNDDEIFAYCDFHDIELPNQYNEGVVSSLECYMCPINMTKARIDYLRKHYPEAAHIVTSVLQETVDDAQGILRDMVDALA